jgi:hypothetical protein
MTKLPTRWKLACALVAAELYDMADRAVVGWYDDFLSPLDTPITQLVNDLQQAGTPAALLVREQVIAGDFDATAEEADTSRPSGVQTQAMRALIGSQAWPPKGSPPKN